jgi:hypothetical protein
MLSTNEAKHVAVVDDWEDDPVAKAVDEPTGAGHGGDTGDDHFVVADPMLPEVVDQVVQPAGAWPGWNRWSLVMSYPDLLSAKVSVVVVDK